MDLRRPWPPALKAETFEGVLIFGVPFAAAGHGGGGA